MTMHWPLFIPPGGKLEDPTYESWITHPTLEALVTKIKCEHILLALKTPAIRVRLVLNSKINPKPRAGIAVLTALQNATKRCNIKAGFI